MIGPMKTYTSEHFAVKTGLYILLLHWRICFIYNVVLMYSENV
jgi:hypothetical protein